MNKNYEMIVYHNLSQFLTNLKNVSYFWTGSIKLLCIIS